MRRSSCMNAVMFFTVRSGRDCALFVRSQSQRYAGPERGRRPRIEHHLFPSMPRPSLRQAQALVRAFCDQQGIAYRETSVHMPRYCGTCAQSADTARPRVLSSALP